MVDAQYSVDDDQKSISPSEASKNVAFLQTQAESWLAVLFNVFGNVPHDGRGMIGEVIGSWIAIAGEEVCDFDLDPELLRTACLCSGHL